MKQLELKLYKHLSSEKEGELKETLVFIPSGDEYKKSVKLVITGEDVIDIAGDLCIPLGIGDTVLIGFGVKNVQTKLEKKKGG